LMSHKRVRVVVFLCSELKMSHKSVRVVVCFCLF
jgi:hypothetical protein